MRIFSEGELGEYLAARLAGMRDTVQREDPDYLLNANETQLVQHLLARHSIDPLVLHLDEKDLMVVSREEMIPAERFPSNFFFGRGNGKYRKQVISYRIRYTGDKQLLRLQPDTYIMWTTEVGTNETGIVSFDVTNWRDDPEAIKAEARQILGTIGRQYQHLLEQVTRFNAALEEHVRSAVHSRKAELLKQRDVLGSLGVGIHRSEQVPSTFAVPTVQKKIVVRPMAPTEAFVPEPAMDQETYDQILRVIACTGQSIEAHPSLYEGKGEESIRDLFLMVLTNNFDSVSAETFNKRGKTDILIRHEGSNVFVAECKIWSGSKACLEALSQLLSYLTWRDSKSALMFFVRGKNLTTVLDGVKTTVVEHECCDRLAAGNADAGRFDFEFHLPTAPSRGVKVAVMCFHLP